MQYMQKQFQRPIVPRPQPPRLHRMHEFRHLGAQGPIPRHQHVYRGFNPPKSFIQRPQAVRMPGMQIPQAVRTPNT